MKQQNIVPFPSGAESNGFSAALSSALMPCLGITPGTPFWCSPNGSWCKRCQNNCDLWHRHQEMLYHTLLTASGAAFTFDYPEDDDVGFHTMPDIPIGCGGTNRLRQTSWISLDYPTNGTRTKVFPKCEKFY